MVNNLFASYFLISTQNMVNAINKTQEKSRKYLNFLCRTKELAQRSFSSIIVITINIWLRFHNGREIWSDEVNALYSLEISSFSSSPVGLLVVIVGFYPAVPGSIPGCRYWIISSFGYFLPFLKICPNFQIFSMSPLLSAKFSKVEIFSGKCRDPKVPLCIVFITGTRWYVHKSGAWKSAFSLLKSGSLQMFTSHK